MEKLIYLTNNAKKMEDVNRYFIENYKFKLDQIDPNFELLDMQATSCSEEAALSVKYAANKLGYPVLKTTMGLCLEALGGLPGPFNKYFYSQIGEDKFLKLLKNEENRNARLEYCLAYCEPGMEPVVFVDVDTGTIASKSKGKNGHWLDLFYISNGDSKTLSQLNKEIYDNETLNIGDAKDRFAKWYLERYKERNKQL